MPESSVNDERSAEEHRWRHLPALDGLRGLAISLVLISHLGAQEGFDVPARFAAICDSGWIGVDLFFVLSGFLITGILIQARDTPYRFRNFYMRRVLRIFPVYYGVLLAVLFGLPILAHAAGLESQLRAALDSVATVGERKWALFLYLQNFVAGPWKMFDQFWSLAVEEHFYIVWPALLFWLPKRWWVRMCLATIAAAIACRLVVVWWDTLPIKPYTATFCRMDSLAIGGLTAVVAARRGIASLAPTAARVVTLLGATLAAWVLVRGGLDQYAWEFETLGYTLIAVFFAGVLVLTAASDSTRGWGLLMNAPALRCIGKYSYGIYVYHRLLILPTFLLLPASKLTSWFGGPIAGSIAYCVIVSSASFGVAYASWHLYEKHFLKIKRYFEYKPVAE